MQLWGLDISKLFKFIVHSKENREKGNKNKISKLFKFTVHRKHDKRDGVIYSFQNFSSL